MAPQEHRTKTTNLAIGSLAAPTLQRRHFYITVSLLMSLIAVVGFWPTYFGPLLRGTLHQPPLMRLHSAIFTGWLVLFLAQVVFAVTGRLAWHRMLGRLAIPYGLLVIVIGFAIGVMRSAALPPGGEAERALFAPLADMVVFGTFFVAAIAYRRRPPIHERLMMVAATMLLIAAVARMSFLPATATRLPLFLAIRLLPITLAMAYDFSRGRGAHPVYLIGLGAFAIRILTTPIAGTAAWSAVAWQILGLVR